MPRKPRIDIPGLLYHVMVRGIERREIFRDDTDREDFVLRLGKVLKWSGAKCYAWALMPNHVHLLLKTAEQPLNRIMRKLLTGYAVNYNIRHRRAGHLFQNRYKSIICEEEAYLLDLTRYIHLNPLRGKIIRDIKELENYRWSGYGALMGGRKQESWQEITAILERFGRSVRKARGNYRNFVKDGIKEGKRKDLTGGGLIRSAGGMASVLLNRGSGDRQLGDDRILGGGAFVGSILKGTEQREKETKRIRKNISIDELMKRVCDYCEVTVAQVEEKTKLSKVSRARAMISYAAMSYLGLTGKQLGERLNKTAGGVSQWYYRGETIFKADKNINDKLLFVNNINNVP